MAIDVIPVKPSVSADGKFQPANNSASGSNINFAELMRSSGMRVSNGFMAFSGQAGLTSITDRPDAALRTDERPRDPIDDQPESYDNPDRKAEQAPGHDNPPPADRHDDFARDQSPASEIGNSDTGQETSAAADHDPRDDTPDDHQQQSSSGETQDQQSDPQKQADGDSGDKSATSGEKPNDQAANGGESTGTTGTGQAKAATANAEQVLHSLLASTVKVASTDKIAKHVASTTDKSGPSLNALANVSKNPGNTATVTEKNAAGGANDVKGRTETGANVGNKGTFSLHAGQTAQAKAAANGQSANTAGNVQNQAATTETPGNDTAARQSAQLSKMIGNGSKVAVTVETSNENAALVSKPSASLTSNAALVRENNGSNGRGHQAAVNSGAAGGQNQANSAQTGLSQAAVALNAAQSRATGSTGGEVKGLVQANQHLNTAGPVAAGAGEGGSANAGSANPNAAPQAQTNAATQAGDSAKASNAPRFSLPGQAVTDQVTVQITKALSAGADKISIQLKPADLGRIDVKMEIGQDGRLTAIVTADNKSTLDLLQRDSKELQQALQNAGLQLDNDSLSFNLREQKEQGDETKTAANDGADEGSEGSGGSGEEHMADIARDIISDTRVDIRA